MSDEEQAFLYEAGYLAGRLEWSDTEVVSVSEVSSVTPAGAPVIVVCGEESLTIDQARAVAALSGAGRPIRVVTAEALPAGVAAWLPEGSIHMVGQEVASPRGTTTIDQAPSAGCHLEIDDKYYRLTDDVEFVDAGKSALAAAMRGVKVGVAWDRHILMPAGGGGFTCVGDSPDVPVKGLSTALVDYSGYEFGSSDLLYGAGVSLTLNVRILNQVILLMCGPFSEDWLNLSGCATASAPFGWGGNSSDVSRGWRMCRLQEGPNVSVAALGDVPAAFSRISGGWDALRSILDRWAAAFFGLIQEGGRAAFCRVGVGFDKELQQDWDNCVEFLEGG